MYTKQSNKTLVLRFLQESTSYDRNCRTIKSDPYTIKLLVQKNLLTKVSYKAGVEAIAGLQFGFVVSKGYWHVGIRQTLTGQLWKNLDLIFTKNKSNTYLLKNFIDNRGRPFEQRIAPALSNNKNFVLHSKKISESGLDYSEVSEAMLRTIITNNSVHAYCQGLTNNIPMYYDMTTKQTQAVITGYGLHSRKSPEELARLFKLNPRSFMEESTQQWVVISQKYNAGLIQIMLDER